MPSAPGSPLQRIVSQYGHEAVYHSVLQLLSDKVYESTSIASQRFPDLFESSTTQTATRAQLGEDINRSDQATLHDIILTHQDDIQDSSNSEIRTTVYDASGNTVVNKVDISSLFPVYLPFPIEHLLMEQLQKILELACYQYGARKIPSIMQKLGWECPESVELSKWAELLGRQGNLERQRDGKPLAELLSSIAQIRHTAVHRLRTSSTGLERFLADAEELSVVLGDSIYTRAISQLRLDARSTFAELARNKEFIQLQLETAQKEITKQRAELDEKEQENLRQMQREDVKYRARASKKLEKALHVLGDLTIASKNENTGLNGMDSDEAVTASEGDSEFDHAEQFEDCSEAWFY
ncbi:hypothetical protein FGLOB1_3274 [Fusarium globosum]|uniref:Uncharacterized protein n=1 Tax=Fusarium globosum TaxID=78864 RepID=A0A8H6DEW6_9HYPO|nr:hypothetical protein FGLOB1_3274 [Fusarium globosum]